MSSVNKTLTFLALSALLVLLVTNTFFCGTTGNRDQELEIERKLGYFWNIVSLYTQDNNDDTVHFVSTNNPPKWWGDYAGTFSANGLDFQTCTKSTRSNFTEESNVNCLARVVGGNIKQLYGDRVQSIELLTDGSIFIRLHR